jgi:hypothetical protein
MRLITLLALATLACSDSTRPRDPAEPDPPPNVSGLYALADVNHGHAFYTHLPVSLTAVNFGWVVFVEFHDCVGVWSVDTTIVAEHTTLELLSDSTFHLFVLETSACFAMDDGRWLLGSQGRSNRYGTYAVRRDSVILTGHINTSLPITALVGRTAMEVELRYVVHGSDQDTLIFARQ